MEYTELTEQIEKIKGSKIIGFLGKEKYPAYIIKRGKGKKVLLIGGVHGDEPAGVLSILEFFKNEVHKYEDHFEFTAFPCIGPSAFQNHSRLNPDHQNLNREFKKDSSAEEIKLILPLLEKYSFVMDFHETRKNATNGGVNEPNGEDPEAFYFWEVCENKEQRVGKKILSEIEKLGIEICKWEKIYGDKNNGGVIWYPEDCGTKCYADGNTTDSFFPREGYTFHAFTMETCSEEPMPKRILAHLTALKVVLDAKR
jgi:hypothetical protein